MANTKSAAKSARQSVRKNKRNSSVITALKSAQKKLHKAIAEGKADITKTDLSKFIASLDKAAKRGIIHRNVANRKKSRLNKALARTKA